jgi:hypothetical protein
MAPIFPAMRQPIHSDDETLSLSSLWNCATSCDHSVAQSDLAQAARLGSISTRKRSLWSHRRRTSVCGEGAPCLPFTAALSDGANGAAIALQYARIKHVISSLPMDGVAGNGNTVTFTVVPAAARRGV